MRNPEKFEPKIEDETEKEPEEEIKETTKEVAGLEEKKEKDEKSEFKEKIGTAIETLRKEDKQELLPEGLNEKIEGLNEKLEGWKNEIEKELTEVRNVYDLARVRDKIIEEAYSRSERAPALIKLEAVDGNNTFSKAYDILDETIRESKEYKEKIKEGEEIERAIEDLEGEEIEIDEKLESFCRDLKSQKMEEVAPGFKEYGFGINISVEDEKIIIKELYRDDFPSPNEECLGTTFHKMHTFLTSEANCLAHSHPIAGFKEIKKENIKKILGPNSQDINNCKKRKVPQMVITYLPGEKVSPKEKETPLFYLYFSNKDDILELRKKKDNYILERYSGDD